MKTFFNVILILLCFQSFSQIQKGKEMFGISSNVSIFTGYKYHNDIISGEMHGINLAPSIGTFINDKLLLGGKADIAFVKLGDIDSDRNLIKFYIGPCFRYYYTENKVKPFVFGDMGFILSWNTASYYTKDSHYTGFGSSMGMGLAYFANERVAIDGSMGFSVNYFSGEGTQLSLGTKIGLSFLY